MPLLLSEADSSEPNSSGSCSCDAVAAADSSEPDASNSFETLTAPGLLLLLPGVPLLLSEASLPGLARARRGRPGLLAADAGTAPELLLSLTVLTVLVVLAALLLLLLLLSLLLRLALLLCLLPPELLRTSNEVVLRKLRRGSRRAASSCVAAARAPVQSP